MANGKREEEEGQGKNTGSRAQEVRGWAKLGLEDGSFMNRDNRVNEIVAPCAPDFEFVAFDLETTGLEAQQDRVVEIGAVRFSRSGQVTGQFEQLVNPGRPMPPAAQAIHGISDADLAAAPPAREVLPRFLDFLGNARSTGLVAHNASFDAAFLGSELRRAGYAHPEHRVFDTLALARCRRPELPSHRLDCLVTAFGLQSAPSHRALADACCVKDLWIELHGPATPDQMLVSYPIHDPQEASPPPHGWEMLDQAIASGRSVRITYDGGTRGISPRSITPLRFQQKGGVAYLVACCHLDSLEKSFRLDRIRQCEILAVAELTDRHVDPGTLNR